MYTYLLFVYGNCAGEKGRVGVLGVMLHYGFCYILMKRVV